MRAMPYGLVYSTCVAALTCAGFLAIARGEPAPARHTVERSTGSTATGDTVLEFVGQIGGFVTVVEVHGDYAYVATGPYVTVLDVSGDGDPRFVGRSDLLAKHGPCIDLAATDGRLFATTGDRDILVVDTSDPRSLRVIATITLEAYAVDQIEVAGQHLFVATYTEVRVYDVAEPRHARLISTTDVLRPVSQLLLDGSRLFVVNAGAMNAPPGGMVVLDVGNPGVPRVLKWLEAINVRFVTAAGDRVFTIVHERITSPSAPDWPRDVESLRILGADFAQLGRLDLGQSAGGPMVATGDTVYVAGGDHILRAIDVRDPASPALVVQMRIPPLLDAGANDLERAAAGRMVLAGTRLYLTFDEYRTSRAGVLLLDLADERAPIPAGEWVQEGPGIVTQVMPVGDLLLVGEPLTSQARIYDCSNRLAPQQVGSIPIDTRTVDFAASGRHVVVVDPMKFHVVDIGDPSRPVIVAEEDVPGGPYRAYAVAMSGRFIYFTLEDEGEGGTDVAQVAVYELTADNRIEPVYRLEFGQWMYMLDTDLRDDHLFISTQAQTPGNGVWIVDVRDPYRPALAGQIGTPKRIRGQTVDGALVYAAVELPITDAEREMRPPPVYPGVRIIDVSEPAQPREVGLATVPQLETGMGYNVQRWGVTVSHGYALLAAAEGYVRAIDVRDPTAPRQVQALQVPGIGSTIATLDDIAYVAGDEAGLLILRLHPEAGEDRMSAIYLPSAINGR